MKVIGNTVGMGLPKPDLSQTDPRKGDFVKGKDKITEAVNAALAQAKESGEFDGKDGADGKTPVKGADYFTEADKQEIAELAAQMVQSPDGAVFIPLTPKDWIEHTSNELYDLLVAGVPVYVTDGNTLYYPSYYNPDTIYFDRWYITGNAESGYNSERDRVGIAGDYMTEITHTIVRCDGADGRGIDYIDNPDGDALWIHYTDGNADVVFLPASSGGDPESGGGGGGYSYVNSDWAVNDTRSEAYVRNRTHWVEEDGILLNENDTIVTSHPVMGHMLMIPKRVHLKVGSTYSVTYNGTTYECVCQSAPAGLVDDPNAMGMGNFSIVGGANTGEPFSMLISEKYESVYIIDRHNASNAEVMIRGEVIHTIPTEYLPEGTPKLFTVDITTGDDGNYVANKRFEKILENAQDNNTIVRAVLDIGIGFILPLVVYTDSQVMFDTSIHAENESIFVSVTILSDNTVTVSSNML